MPEFYEIVHAHIRDGVEEETIARRLALDFAEGLAHHRGEVAAA